MSKNTAVLFHLPILSLRLRRISDSRWVTVGWRAAWVWCLRSWTSMLTPACRCITQQPRTLSTTSAVSRLADSCVQAIISLLPHTSWALLTPPSSTVTTGVQFRCFPRQPRPRTVCGGLLNVHYISPHNRHNVFSVQCHYDQPPAAGVMIKQFDSTYLHHNNINLETLVCCTRWAVACLAHKNISWHLLLCYDSHHRKDTAPATHIFS